MQCQLSCLYDPVGLVTGGFTGLCIVIKEVTEGIVDGGIPLWLSNLIFKHPSFSGCVEGKRKTVHLADDHWNIPALCVDLCDTGGGSDPAGLFPGSSFWRLYRRSRNGTDSAWKGDHRRYGDGGGIAAAFLRHYSVVQIMQVLDAMIVLFGLYMFGLKAGMYAIVAIFVTTKVSDGLMEGFKYSKSAFIITDHYEAVADRVLQELDRGLTGLYAKGMYSGTDKCSCTVSYPRNRSWS